VKLRGYYEVDIGGRGLINPIALVQHHTGSESAPQWFLRSLQERAP